MQDTIPVFWSSAYDAMIWLEGKMKGEGRCDQWNLSLDKPLIVRISDSQNMNIRTKLKKGKRWW
jgi:hypothetical protein